MMNCIFRRIAGLSLATVMLASSCILPLNSRAFAEGTSSSDEDLSGFVSHNPHPVRINEVMTKNSATVQNEAGVLSDWIELYNYSDQSVNLGGWTLSAENGSYVFPDVNVAAGSYTLIWADTLESTGTELHTGFTISDKNSVSLSAEDGTSVDAMAIPKLGADRSFAVGSHGEYSVTSFPTPGYENSDEGYDRFMEARIAPEKLIINELMVSNVSYAKVSRGKATDWIELYNNTGHSIDLGEYTLSDSASEPDMWRFPSMALTPGQMIVVYCDGDDTIDSNNRIHTNFSLNSKSERVFVNGPDGLNDYVYVHDVPSNISYGRHPSSNGFYYFTIATPGTDNLTDAYRTISAPSVVLTPDGMYNNVESVTVKLGGSGTIYYTLDGSLPDKTSSVYQGPFDISSTTVVRSINVDGDKMPSEPVTSTYIINENHTLPVVSLVTNNHSEYLQMYNGCDKNAEIPGVFTLYELNGNSVTNRCGIVLSGAGTVYSMPKKSLSVLFRNRYGDGDIDYDVFETGQTRYSGLTMRAGEAFCTSVIRSDLFQDLSLQIDDYAAITQHSKHCIVYVDGQYFGIMTLKERFTQEYFADMTGVLDPDTVTIIKYPVQGNSDFYHDVIEFCNTHDMTLAENYDYFCSVVNVESFIDWIIVEGYSANPDIGDNMRLMMSTENGQWYFTLYDLDWAYQTSDTCFSNLMFGSEYNSLQMKMILQPLMQNSVFLDQLCTRYAQVWNTVLSNENVLRMLDDYQELLYDEVGRDRDKWGNSHEVWLIHMDRLRNFVIDSDFQNAALSKFCETFHLSVEQRIHYFGA